MKSSMFLVIVSLLSLLPQPSVSTTIVVDGVSEWKNPIVSIGDSVIFKHKNHYNLYIFQNQKAFDLCNFTQATLLTKQNSTSFTWYPSRPGFFYFTFRNGSLGSCDQPSQKLSIKVIQAPSPPSMAPPIPAPVSGKDGTPPSPPYPWPFQPREAASSPASGPSSGAKSPMTVPTLVPDKGGGMPFINSNPAVPLPTGEVDSATIRPFATSSAYHQRVEVEVLRVHMIPLLLLLILLYRNN